MAKLANKSMSAKIARTIHNADSAIATTRKAFVLVLRLTHAYLHCEVYHSSKLFNPTTGLRSNYSRETASLIVGVLLAVEVPTGPHVR